MNAQRRWIGYDTFKLIVALVLLALLLFLLFQRTPVTPITGAGQETQVGLLVDTETPLAPMDTIAPPTSTPTVQAPSTETPLLPTDTMAPPAPTSTVQASSTPTPVLPTATPLPSPTSTSASVPLTATSTPTAVIATSTPVSADQPAPTATPQAETASGDCPLAQPSQLTVGTKAMILRNLNLRKEAGMDKEIIRVGFPNSTVEIIGGPVCIPYQNGAYLWWNIQSADGVTGWSAEASLSKGPYFLQAIR